jgi:catechol 2,3-dioxygenase-like lactoylglutathione lyase family enzyme
VSFVDDILFFFEQLGDETTHAPTDGHVLGHLAFAVPDLNAWRTWAEETGVSVVAEPAETHGFTSFFVRGPDGMLLELVEAEPAPGECLD